MNQTNLTYIQKQILYGLLLSDAGLYIDYRNKNPKPIFQLSSITKSFIEDIKNNIPFIYGPIIIRKSYKTQTYTAKESYLLRSHIDSYLIKEYYRWYIQRKKVVPKDFILTPLILKYWFYGDGSTSYKTKVHNTVCLTLSSNSFTLDEVQFLIKRLNIDCGLSGFFIHNNKGPEIQTNNTKLIQKFFDYIGNCDIIDFKYKWKIPYFIKGDKYESRNSFAD